MVATVWIPPLMRDLTGGRERVDATGVRVGDLIAAIDTEYPGVAARLVDGDELRRGIIVTVDGVASRRGLRQPVSPDDEVHFLPAIGGGTRRAAPEIGANSPHLPLDNEQMFCYTPQSEQAF